MLEMVAAFEKASGKVTNTDLSVKLEYLWNVFVL